jgi:hypothetical protein
LNKFKGLFARWQDTRGIQRQMIASPFVSVLLFDGSDLTDKKKVAFYFSKY